MRNIICIAFCLLFVLGAAPPDDERICRKPSVVCQQTDWNFDGIVNLYDFAIVAGEWPGELWVDLNCDKIIDWLDLARIAEDWLTASTATDLNFDGIVDFYDLAIMGEKWLWEWPRFSIMLPVTGDCDYDGLVDYRDIAMLAEDWLGVGRW